MLFSGEMVRAILSGKKTQTRRPVTPRTSLVNGHSPCMKADPEIISAWPNLDFAKAWVDNGPSPAGNPGQYLQVPGGDDSTQRVCSRIQPGDRIWVRETHRVNIGGGVSYQADQPERDADDERELARLGPQHAAELRWRPSIHMPRWAARIVLEVTEVRAQRVQDIGEDDAKAEGVSLLECTYVGRCNSNRCPMHGLARRYARGFEMLWSGMYADGLGWVANPLVWALTLRRVES